MTPRTVLLDTNVFTAWLKPRSTLVPLYAKHLNMLVLPDGRERTEAECAHACAAASRSASSGMSNPFLRSDASFVDSRSNSKVANPPR